MWTCRSAALWGLLLLMGRAWAQDPVAIRYTIEDGLPSNEVYDAYEDTEGNIWFATDHGVSRFDGYEFENFSTADGLSDNTVFGFAEDANGRVWMRCLDGSLSCLDNGVLSPYQHNPKLRKHLRGQFVQTFHFDGGHRMYFVTSSSWTSTKVLDLNSGELVASNWPPGTWQGMFTPAGSRERIPIMSVDSTAPSGEPAMQERTFPEGALRYWQLSAASPPWFYSRNINISMGADQDVGIFLGRLYAIDSGRMIHEQRLPNWMRCLDMDREGKLWLSGGKGVVALTDSFAFGRQMFENEAIFKVLQDRNGCYWITGNHGILQIRDIQSCLYESANGLPLKRVNRIQIADGWIYVLYDDNAVIRGKVENTRIDWEERWKVRLDNKPAHDFGILSDSGRILVHPQAINIARGQLDQVPPWFQIKGTAWQYRLQDEQLSVATNRGAWTFELNGMATAHRLGSEDYITTAILQDQRGRIWVGTTDGLRIYNANHQLKWVSSDKGLKHRVTDLAMLEDGTVVVGTRGWGLFFFKDAKVHWLHDNSGLPSDMCDRMYLGPSGLWICTPKGLSLLPKRDLAMSRLPQCKPLNLGVLEGMPTHQVNDVVENGSHIYVGTEQGLVVMATPQRAAAPLVPRVDVPRLKAAHRWVTDSEELRTDEDNLEFHFRVGAVPNTENLWYRYRLDGYDHEWRVTRERSVTYYALPPGPYTFRVAAFYDDKPEISVESTRAVWLPYQVQETLWFRGAVGLLVLLTIFLGSWWYLRSRHRQIQNYMTRLQAEVKALRSQMQPHFMFNALTSIQHLILMNDNATAHQHLVGFAQLMRGILEAIRSETIPISQEVTLLKGYLELEKLRLGDKFEYEVALEPGRDWSRYAIPPMLLQPLVENAIWHGLQLQKVNPTMWLRFGSAEDGMICCEVEDNGIGRAAASKIVRKHLGPSVALDNIRSRIALINATNGSLIQLEILDLTHPDGTPRGTLARLLLPIQKV